MIPLGEENDFSQNNKEKLINKNERRKGEHYNLKLSLRETYFCKEKHVCWKQVLNVHRRDDSVPWFLGCGTEKWWDLQGHHRGVGRGVKGK